MSFKTTQTLLPQCTPSPTVLTFLLSFSDTKILSGEVGLHDNRRVFVRHDGIKGR